MLDRTDNSRFRPLQIAAIVAVAGYWLVLFYGTHSPPVDRVQLGPSDKWLHFAAFFGLAFLLCLCRSLFSGPTLKSYAAIAVLLAAYGAFDELSQPRFRRNAELADWLADLTGIAVGLCSFAAIRWIALAAGIAPEPHRAEAPLADTWYPGLPDRSASLEDSPVS